ncbi:MAG: hypothetical protein FWF59_08815 [Turicibacter sp.]|nr:hypothetical protein [Turicibacter sp.]
MKWRFFLVGVLFLVACASEVVDESKSTQHSDFAHTGKVDEQSLLPRLIEGASFGNENPTGETLSIEEAFTKSLYNFYHIFGETLKEKAVVMTYNYNHQISERTWAASVLPLRSTEYYLEGDVEILTTDTLWGMEIDAYSGELISMGNQQPSSILGYTYYEIMDFNEDRLWELFPAPDNYEVEKALAIITEIASQLFDDTQGLVLGTGFFDSSGIEIPYFPSWQLVFHVVDGKGDVFDIILQRESFEILLIMRPFSQRLV